MACQELKHSNDTNYTNKRRATFLIRAISAISLQLANADRWFVVKKLIFVVKNLIFVVKNKEFFNYELKHSNDTNYTNKKRKRKRKKRVTFLIRAISAISLQFVVKILYS